MQHRFDVVFTSMGSPVSSQFPLWDFVECNLLSDGRRLVLTPYHSQFPLWDFVECNKAGEVYLASIENGDSQFPLWDFVECNWGE